MPVYNVIIKRTSHATFTARYQLVLCSCLHVGSGSVFSVLHCSSFYGKYNKLPTDAIRGELEHSGNDDYLSDLDEEFCDLSSEEDYGVNQVSRAEPSCKKARISVRTLSVDSEDSEGEIGVERTERRVIKSE
jgi:hypothetical protein